MTLSLVSCSDHSDDDAPHGPTSIRRSLIIYMAAQNSLGSSGAARLDSAEIARGAMSLNDNDNIFLFIDDVHRPRLYRLYRYRGRTITDKVWTSPTDLCSTDPATLRDLLTHIRTTYPSQSYALVLWSHADGWLPSTNVVNTLDSIPSVTALRSFGIDVGTAGSMTTDRDSTGHTGPQMDIDQLERAIQQSHIHLDYIFFDACLMQNIEVAYQLRHVTDYIIASATSTSAYGGYYDNLLPRALLLYPANDANVSLIADQYYYDAVLNPDLKKYYGQTGNAISVIKTSQLDTLARVTANYLPHIFANRAEPPLPQVTAYANSTYFTTPDYYDLGALMHHLLTPTQYAHWQQVAQQSIIHHRASSRYIQGYYHGSAVTATLYDPDHILATSIFVPRDRYTFYNYNQAFRYTPWYQDAGWSTTGW